MPALLPTIDARPEGSNLSSAIRVFVLHAYPRLAARPADPRPAAPVAAALFERRTGGIGATTPP